ncbi:MAG: isochorismatase family cysteine hydrolase [Kiloniellales bacterium]
MISVPCRSERHFDFEPAGTALLVVDMQRDFLERGGEEGAALRAVIPRVRDIVAAARAAGLTIVHTREGYAPDRSDVTPAKAAMGYVGRPGPDGPFLIRGARGHDFADELKPAEDEPVIDKPGFSAFYRTELEAALRERRVTHLVLAGVTTQCCVHSTLRDAVERGFFCLTVEDACAAVDPALHEAALTVIQGEDHLFGWIARARDLLAALEGNAT